MRYSLAAGAVLAASASLVSGQSCASGSASLIGGNWYCELIESIIYDGFPTSGKYNGVKSMSEDGTCTMGDIDFSGPLGVFGDELSIHLRGPAQLKKLAVYSSGSSSSSKKREVHDHAHAHAHANAHAHAHEHAKRGNVVTATIDDQVVTWTQGPVANAAEAVQSKAADAADWIVATIKGQVVSWPNQNAAATQAAQASSVTPAASSSSSKSSSHHLSEASTATSSASSSHSTKLSGKTTSGSWTRQAYYDASSGSADGLVFLNHKGGEGSGTWDSTYGNSLSYASSDGTKGASSSQVLADTELDDSTEIVIMSDTKCDNDCGATRPKTVAYHGFGGNHKVIVAQVKMPMSGKTGTNADMPALWLLNAAIPRTSQYGSCSCWKGGCGEFDILEVLDTGNKRAKSTIHAVSSGGDSNYFDRPVDSAVNVAIVFDGDNAKAHIKTLTDFDYSSSLSSSEIESLCEQASKSATFKLASS